VLGSVDFYQLDYARNYEQTFLLNVVELMSMARGGNEWVLVAVGIFLLILDCYP